MNVIGRRFHECLKVESEGNPELRDTMSDSELVHVVCRKERLTFFNFMREHTTDHYLFHEEYLKEQLNKEYGHYFKKNGELAEIDFYGNHYLRLDSRLRPNSLNKRFTVEFE